MDKCVELLQRLQGPLTDEELLKYMRLRCKQRDPYVLNFLDSEDLKAELSKDDQALLGECEHDDSNVEHSSYHASDQKLCKKVAAARADAAAKAKPVAAKKTQGCTRR